MWNLHVTLSKGPDYCLELCFLLTENYFLFSLFYCLPKKRIKKKKRLRVKQQLGKMNWKNCRFMNLPDIHIFHFMSPPDLWYLVFSIDSELHHQVCVHGNLHIVLWSKWPRKVIVPRTVHWLCTVQVWNQKDKLWHDFGASSSFF